MAKIVKAERTAKKIGKNRTRTREDDQKGVVLEVLAFRLPKAIGQMIGCAVTSELDDLRSLSSGTSYGGYERLKRTQEEPPLLTNKKDIDNPPKSPFEKGDLVAALPGWY